MKTVITRPGAAADRESGQQEDTCRRVWCVLALLALTVLAAPTPGHAQVGSPGVGCTPQCATVAQPWTGGPSQPLSGAGVGGTPGAPPHGPGSGPTNKPPRRGAPCHWRCWARASVFGNVLITADPSASTTLETANFDLESNAAFIIDFKNSLTISANLHGSMSSFKEEWRGPARTCRTTYYAFSIPDHLHLEANLGAGPQLGRNSSTLFFTLGSIHPASKAQIVHEHQHQDGYDCEGRTYPATDRIFTHDNGVIDYWWPFETPVDAEFGWPLSPSVRMHPGQLTFAQTFQFRGAYQYEVHYTATVHVFIELCPDQNLAHNCAIPELPALPQ